MWFVMKHRLRAEGFVEFLNKNNCGVARPTCGTCFRLEDGLWKRTRKLFRRPTAQKIVYDENVGARFVENCATAWYWVKRALRPHVKGKLFDDIERLLIRVPRVIELPKIIIPVQDIDLYRRSRDGVAQTVSYMCDGEYRPLANMDKAKFGDLVVRTDR